MIPGAGDIETKVGLHGPVGREVKRGICRGFSRLFWRKRKNYKKQTTELLILVLFVLSVYAWTHIPSNSTEENRVHTQTTGFLILVLFFLSLYA